MNRYQRVEWRHDFDDEPITIFSEVADFGREVRKVEVYRDGRADFADEHNTTGSTDLSETQLPSLEEIEEQAEFAPSTISAAEFELVWVAATTKHRWPGR